MLNLCLQWLASPQQDSDREFYCYQSLSAAFSRRRDGVATQGRCPDPGQLPEEPAVERLVRWDSPTNSEGCLGSAEYHVAELYE